jgi:hypothetical protein
MPFRRQPLIDDDALMRAAQSGDTEAIKVLIAAGANVNATVGNGETALMRAAANGHIDAVRLLLDKGASADARRHDGFTALICAAFFGHTDVARVLLAKGADVFAKDRLGSTARQWASSRGFDDTAEMLGEAETVRSRAGTTRRAPDINPASTQLNRTMSLEEANAQRRAEPPANESPAQQPPEKEPDDHVAGLVTTPIVIDPQLFSSYATTPLRSGPTAPEVSTPDQRHSDSEQGLQTVADHAEAVLPRESAPAPAAEASQSEPAAVDAGRASERPAAPKETPEAPPIISPPLERAPIWSRVMFIALAMMLVAGAAFYVVRHYADQFLAPPSPAPATENMGAQPASPAEKPVRRAPASSARPDAAKAASEREAGHSPSRKPREKQDADRRVTRTAAQRSSARRQEPERSSRSASARTVGPSRRSRSSGVKTSTRKRVLQWP